MGVRRNVTLATPKDIFRNSTQFPLLIFAILFLFLIQSALTLVESIYILDLMNTTLDEKALGVLFFFTPLILLFFSRPSPRWMVWALFAALAIARGLLPHLPTSGRLLASGIAAAAALLLIPILLLEWLDSSDPGQRAVPAAALALAAAASVALRTVNSSLDFSLETSGSFIGWALGAILGVLLVKTPPGRPTPASPHAAAGKTVPSPLLAGLGWFSTFGLVMFAFASPAVIVRWAEGSYPLTVLAASALSSLSMLFLLWKPAWVANLRPSLLLAWNLLFTLALTALIASHTVAFPAAPDSPAVIAGASSSIHSLLLVLTLLLFPVIYADFSIFTRTILDARPSLRRLAPGLLLGSFFLVLMIFINIFSNVWAYVEPVSPPFRNTFWLAFLLMAGVNTFLAGWLGRLASATPLTVQLPRPSSWLAIGKMPGLLAGVVFVAVPLALLFVSQTPLPPSAAGSLVVMTYNIQAANDGDAQKAYDRQLALIRQVNPDILALQESDTTRISLANNDYVRYFADNLGYHSYFGPKTVTGTFGTALLSKYPLENARTIFSYSDEDEIGTAAAEIVVAGRRLTIYNVHPDGSDTAMIAFAQVLLEQTAGAQDVILLGDFNLRQSEPAYQLIASHFQNAWLSIYPTGVDADGLDMSGDRRIDHIFVSSPLRVVDAVYLLPPASATDHPAHWAVIELK